MSDSDSIFHLAIPCRDLDEAAEFYVEKLECRLARRYDDRITLDFFGDQVVCHLAPESIDLEPTMYPRHFGRTFRDRSQFDGLLGLAQEQGLKLFREPFLRFEGMREEHVTFFLCDPSNNLLEFKFYNDPEMIY